ncbi:MAG: RluA family pseudouridine synthase [Treponema sp.]|jgi:23S rRNA pseudouridine955/2504/2580 synthase|nr:RluA family pseudouridine synthase [Treponema sp.]
MIIGKIRGKVKTHLKRITVLFENESCLVLNKPAGLAVQGGEGVGVSLDSILTAEYFPRPLLVHRLDRDTSGVILTAKTKEDAARFSRLFAERASAFAEPGILKQYLAVCSGAPAAETGVITLDLAIRGSKKKSETGFRCVKRSGDFSVLELELGSGRMHQIRRHLALTGTPVLGDDKYGNFALNRELRKKFGLRRLLLHASRLFISEALTGFPGGLDVTAPLPDYFENFLDVMSGCYNLNCH